MGVDTVQMLVLACADLPRSLCFYVEGLCLPLLRGDETLAVVRAGLLDLALSQEPFSAAQTPSVASDSITLVFKVSAIEDVFQRLQLHDYRPELDDSIAGNRLIAVRDPDGRELQLLERAI